MSCVDNCIFFYETALLGYQFVIPQKEEKFSTKKFILLQ